MRRVGIVTHPRRPPALNAAETLVARLEDDAVETIRLPDEPRPDPALAEGLDLVVSVGGDGTFLRAALVAAAAGCPVLGVKVGRMGFLTEVEPAEAPALIGAVLDGTARIEERLALTAEPVDGAGFEPQWALNEIMVEKESRHRLVRLRVEVDGVYVTTFSADGVIVATPTGSTAYSFSSRGPIVGPELDSLVVTPIAAHMVFDRSFVLGPERVVELRVEAEENALVSADGRESVELPVGGGVRIRRADRPARLVRRGDAPGFLSLVREKFGLPGDPGPSGGVGAGS
jgi:NAD+ kinase